MRDVHLLNPMENAFGGSEQRTIALASLLRGRANVKIWSLGTPDPRLHPPVSMTPVDVAKLRFPRGGTLIIVGCYFEIPAWVSVARPERIVLVYNIPIPAHLRQAAYVLAAYGLSHFEVIAASRTLADEASKLGFPCNGHEPSWLDLDRFMPGPGRGRSDFVVGRLSRDVPDKFHSEDPKLYKTIAKEGMHVRIMGGTLLRSEFAGVSGIELLEAGVLPPERFLKSLDAVLYRTSERWIEAWGRVVSEAMACGLPVVLDRRVGIAEELADGHDVLLFDTNDEAVAHLSGLRDDPELRTSIGMNGRKTVERLFGPDVKRKWVEFYLRPR